MNNILRFLGSVYFAITLIALTALFVIAGTFLESFADSHQYAASFTYENPIFTLLLGGFFINILLAALRRWPFKWKHTPFLITHLGLLMILSGVIVKNIWGLQGTLVIWEGSGSHDVFLSHSHMVEVLPRGQSEKKRYPIRNNRIGAPNMQIIASVPHAEEHLESWIKGDWLCISGFPKLRLNNEISKAIGKIGSFKIFAGRAEHPLEVAKQLLVEGPTLAFIQDPTGAVHYFARDAEDQVHTQDKWSKIVVYDNGFLGYYTQVTEPFNLESSLQHFFKPLTPLVKREENKPAIKLQIDDEQVVLGFDPTGEGLMWPTQSGKYLVRFQPELSSIPYHVRLRQARQVSYANTNQPFSYECDIVISNRNDGSAVEKTLSMNHVHETWDGYRFYLSGINPPSPGEVKRASIVVNKDPAKYLLTYPGAVILSMGIFGLFWIKWDDKGRPSLRGWGFRNNGRMPREQ